jgi:hypothetical protein
MSTRAQAQYLRVYVSGGSDIELWQNYYVDTTVTVSAKDYTYFPFEFGGIFESSAIGGAPVDITLPATQEVIDLFIKASYLDYLCEVSVYEFDSRLGNTAPVSSQTLVSSFTGYVRNMSGSFTTLSVRLGSALAPVGAQIPPRTYSSSLIGAPIRT